MVSCHDHEVLQVGRFTETIAANVAFVQAFDLASGVCR